MGSVLSQSVVQFFENNGLSVELEDVLKAVPDKV